MYDWSAKACITKTYLYNFDPLKPHFHIVKLGFTGVYINFLISDQNIDCGYALELPRRTNNLCFEQKHENYQKFLSENFHFLVIKFAVCLNRYVFVMWTILGACEGRPDSAHCVHVRRLFIA